MAHSAIPLEIVNRFNLVNAITNKVATRIHYQTIPQESVYPHIYITRTGIDGEPCLSGEPGITTETYTIELIGHTFDATLVDAIVTTLEDMDGTVGSGTVFLTEVDDASDDYQFQSADGDADFLHAFRVTVIHDGDV